MNRSTGRSGKTLALFAAVEEAGPSKTSALAANTRMPHASPAVIGVDGSGFNYLRRLTKRRRGIILSL